MDPAEQAATIVNVNAVQNVNAADLPPPTENVVPMPGDLPSYANYMGKFVKGVVF